MTTADISRSCRFAGCRRRFETYRIEQVYCSVECSKQSNTRNFHDINPPREVSTSTTGAVGELLVAADLMKSGYSVFRALSPSCSCDLAVLHNGKLCRVEVRSGNRSVSGDTTYYNKGDTSRYDVMAVIFRDGEIVYYPRIEEWFRNSFSLERE